MECFEKVKRSPKNQNMMKNGAKEERERSRKITMNKKSNYVWANHKTETSAYLM